MAVVRVPGSIERINAVLEQLFGAHGIEAVSEENTLRFPAFPGFWMNAEAFNPLERAGQVDFRLGIAPDRMLCESVAGLGTTPEKQIEDGLRAFASNSFHVLLSAFFGVPRREGGIDREEWEIGGAKRVVFLGTIGSRFGFPPGADGKPDVRFFPVFKQHIQAQPLPPGTHWVRLYQMRFRGACTANEVLLDNHPWPELQNAMAAYDWPVNEKYYDVRLFLVIRDPEEVSPVPSDPDS
jgi:hypothetical protein